MNSFHINPSQGVTLSGFVYFCPRRGGLVCRFLSGNEQLIRAPMIDGKPCLPRGLLYIGKQIPCPSDISALFAPKPPPPKQTSIFDTHPA
ncbi:MAG: hypothetical protein FWD49_07910 [Firmicutes bacterium]|nr:hypothetical protein [Bacillota bacterium]